MIIFLIGFMGSGKSYYADKIAVGMGIPYIDLDAAIVEENGRSISEIFALEGEAEFRRMEASALRKTAASLSAGASASSYSDQQFVGLIACGGGTPCFHDNMKWMNDHGLTVWINPPIEVLKMRLKTEKADRPLIAKLDDEALGAFIQNQLLNRTPYYSEAKIQVKDPATPIEQIIQTIQHA